MRLEKASAKAIKYACVNFHYSKCNPNSSFGYSVFNSENEFCGVILFGVGANNNIGSPYGLVKGQVAELVRVALNGKQSSTVKVLSLGRKLFKKDNPTVRLLISFADSEQQHKGTIYQADNWYYNGDTISSSEYLYNGKRWHGRAFRSQYGSHTKYVDKGLQIINGSTKHRYIYPLDKSLVPLCKSLAKPYPKKTNAAIVQGSISGFQSEDGSRTDLAAQTGQDGI